MIVFLNIGQSNFTEQKLLSISENQNIKLRLSTNNKEIVHKIGDRPYSEICDYMESCEYKCIGNNRPVQETSKDLYTDNFLQSNNGRIMKRIREIYRDRENGEHFYNLSQIIDMVNAVKQYPIEQIYSALSIFIKNKNEYIIDKYGRRGNLINKGNIYAFQPVEINDESITVFERKIPIDYKRSNVIMEIPKEFDENKSNASLEKINYREILNEINFKLENATSVQNIPHGEQNWYKHASKVLNHLQLVHNISYEDYVKYIIHHNIDMLMPDKKMVLISHICIQKYVIQRICQKQSKK